MYNNNNIDVRKHQRTYTNAFLGNQSFLIGILPHIMYYINMTLPNRRISGILYIFIVTMSIINYNGIDIIGTYKYYNIIHIEGHRT